MTEPASSTASMRKTLGPHGQSWFVSGDWDGFFGLAVDNLIQFLLVLSLCTAVLDLPMAWVTSRILPGAAISILVGNLYYAYQSRKLSSRTRRQDVTALPYGINTVSLFAFVFVVMLPVRLEALARGASAPEAALAAWQVGLAACFWSGIIELVGALVAEPIRRHTPRAALLSTLAGIAISFIAIDFAIRTFAMPLVAMLPLGIIFATYFARIRMPLRIPGGAWAVIAGSLGAWLMAMAGHPDTPVSAAAVGSATASIGWHPPLPVMADLWAGLTHPLTMQFLVPVILPMGLFNVLGSLQNLESAEAAGDTYPSMPSLAVNGAGSLVACCLGSCFPTTIYIGHPGWKGLGARTGYSILNGVFFTLIAVFGLSALVYALIPIEAGMAIVLWIGIMITAQAFQATSRAHAPAVAVGLFPAIAGWGVLILTQTLGATGDAMGDPTLAGRVLAQPFTFHRAGLHLEGLVALSQGFMLTGLVWSAIGACLIDRRPLAAAGWAASGACFSFFGFMHAGHLTPSGGTFHIGWATGVPWAIGYAACALSFASMQRLVQQRAAENPPEGAGGEKAA